MGEVINISASTQGETAGPTAANVAVAERGPFYPIHPIADEYAEFTVGETARMEESLRVHGLLVPILIWHGRMVDGEAVGREIVDGQNRYKLCCRLSVELGYNLLRYRDITDDYPTEQEMIAYVRVLNEHRRANTTSKTMRTAEKRVLIAATLKANHQRSNLQIAEELGVDDKTVEAVRKELVGRSEIPDVETRKDSQGRSQPAKKSSQLPKVPEDRLTYREAKAMVDLADSIPNRRLGNTFRFAMRSRDAERIRRAWGKMPPADQVSLAGRARHLKSDRVLARIVGTLPAPPAPQQVSFLEETAEVAPTPASTTLAAQQGLFDQN